MFFINKSQEQRFWKSFQASKDRIFFGSQLPKNFFFEELSYKVLLVKDLYFFKNLKDCSRKYITVHIEFPVYVHILSVMGNSTVIEHFTISILKQLPIKHILLLNRFHLITFNGVNLNFLLKYCNCPLISHCRPVDLFVKCIFF